MEVAGHEEMECAPINQTLASYLNKQRRKIGYHIDDKEIPCYYRNVSKHLDIYDLRIYYLLFIAKCSLRVQNYEKYLVYSTKSAL
jgi:hypothetical protein